MVLAGPWFYWGLKFIDYTGFTGPKNEDWANRKVLLGLNTTSLMKIISKQTRVFFSPKKDSFVLSLRFLYLS